MTVPTVDKGTLYDKLDLHAGQIVSVNGKKLDSLEAAQRFAELARTEDNLEMVIARDGKTQTRKYRMK